MEKSDVDSMPPVYTVCSIELDPSVPSPPSYESVFGNTEQNNGLRNPNAKIVSNQQPKATTSSQSGANGDSSTQSGTNANSATPSRANGNSTSRPKQKTKNKIQPASRARAERKKTCDDFSLVCCFRMLSRPGPWIAVLLPFLIIPVSFIVTGSLFVHDCPKSSVLPVIVIVDGGLLFVTILLFLRIKINEYLKNEIKDQDFDKVFGLLAPVIIFGSLGCFIGVTATTYEVFRSDWVSDSTSDKYCHPVLVYFTFSVVTAILSFIGLSLILWILDGILMPPIKRWIANR